MIIQHQTAVLKKCFHTPFMLKNIPYILLIFIGFDLKYCFSNIFWFHIFMTGKVNLFLKSNWKRRLPSSIVCLFRLFLPTWRIFRSFGDVPITGEGLQLFNLYSAIEQWCFLNDPHLLWQWPAFYNGHLRSRARDTHICCQA